MTPFWRKVTVICALSLPSLASAQSGDGLFDIVGECDLLAAHPDDPLRVAPGVSDEEIVPRLAVDACEAALAESDSGPRHAFQLGRAMLELDRREDAVRMFERAAKEGSALAYLFLGDATQFGWNEERDGEAAMGFYEAARNRGLLIADIAIAQVRFDSDIFTTGAMIEALATRQTETAIRFAGNLYAKAYLYGFALELAGRCGSFLDPTLVGTLEEYRFPEGWSAASEEGDRLLGRQDVLATYDVEILVDRHGCNGTVIEAVAETYNAMLRRLGE